MLFLQAPSVKPPQFISSMQHSMMASTLSSDFTCLLAIACPNHRQITRKHISPDQMVVSHLHILQDQQI